MVDKKMNGEHEDNSDIKGVEKSKKQMKKEAKVLRVKERKDLKEKKKKERLNKKINKKQGLIEFEVDGQKYKLKKESFFELARKDVKIQHNQNKINNGEVAILYLRNSGYGEFKYVKPENNMFVINNKYYHQKSSCVYTIGKKRTPMAVIPEWSFIPITRNEHGELLGIDIQEAQTQAIKAMETVEIVRRGDDGDKKKGKSADAKTIIIIVIVAIIAIAVLPKLLGGA